MFHVFLCILLVSGEGEGIYLSFHLCKRDLNLIERINSGIENAQKIKIKL